jgi:ABC-type amino acid transport system permease subunit
MPNGEELKQATEHTQQLKRIFDDIRQLQALNERISWWTGVNTGIMAFSIVVLIGNIIALLLAVPTLGGSLVIAFFVDIVLIIVNLVAVIDKILIEYYWEPDQKRRLASLKIELEQKKINLDQLIETINEN